MKFVTWLYFMIVKYILHFFIDHPTITYFPHNVSTVNETNNVSMVCRAESVPEPTITWIKTGITSEILAYGEQFQIVNTRSRDDGKYTCIASNYLGQDSREVILNVQSKYFYLMCNKITTNHILLHGKIFHSLKCVRLLVPRPKPGTRETPEV